MLRDYLDVYFDTVVSDPRLDCLNITLVDGFAGGGAYQNGDEIADGSPLVLLHAVERARERLNRNRKKPLEINARFFFINDKTIFKWVNANIKIIIFISVHSMDRV